MSLIKKARSMDEEMKELVARINRIEKNMPLLDKGLSMDYMLAYYPPIISFKCIGDSSYSFKTHKYLFNEGLERAFWSEAAKQQEKVLFNGYATRGYSWRLGSLRGYISTLTNNRRIGVYVRNGIVKDLLTEDVLLPYQAWLAESTDIDADNKEQGEKKNAKKE